MRKEGNCLRTLKRGEVFERFGEFWKSKESGVWELCGFWKKVFENMGNVLEHGEL